MPRDECEHAVPRIRGSLRVLLEAPVEEAVWRAVVRDELVLDSGGLEGRLERSVLLRRNVIVDARLQSQDGGFEPGCEIDGARPAGAGTERSVEPDRTGEAMPAGRGEPGVAAAETEADREDGRAAAALRGAEIRDRGSDILLDAFRGRLSNVIHVREVVAPLLDPGG